jgi:hypothetical protein
MKHILLSCLFALLHTALSAQPVIQQNDLLHVGDIVVTQPCTVTASQPGPAGANQTWDFSGLTPTSSLDTTYYIAPAGTPYAASYPASNIVAFYSGNTYGYYQIVNNELFYFGEKDPTGGLVLTDPAVYFKLPTT